MNIDFEYIQAAASAAEGATSGQQMQDAFNGNFDRIADNFTELNASATAAAQDISVIESLIPATASPTNRLADRDFVNSSIVATAARPLTYDAAGNPFPTKASLDSATTFYNKGAAVTPTENDYVVVQADETQAGGQVRYGYDGTGWVFRYRINDAPFTTAQNAAINSGMTAAMVAALSVKTAVISGEAVFSYDSAIQFTAAVKGSSAESVTFRIDGGIYDETTIAGVVLPAAKYMLVNAYPAVAGVPYGSVTVKFKTI